MQQEGLESLVNRLRARDTAQQQELTVLREKLAQLQKLADDRGEALSLAELQAIEPRIKPDIIGQLSVEHAVATRTSFGGTAPDEVRARIADAKQRFGLT